MVVVEVKVEVSEAKAEEMAVGQLLEEVIAGMAVVVMIELREAASEVRGAIEEIAVGLLEVIGMVATLEAVMAIESSETIELKEVIFLEKRKREDSFSFWFQDL